ncbi:hypothetical protein Glove_372g56 [Diversispora epigaea]|uniref:TLDc domain-containing protein n=1 Tax=Diversispora epigaea TaxID=1348612 RepID=A0A397H6F7_9GLOM|nr:hypothetical protein Glove_372g56 [Diversispora epigaea]
MSLKFFDKLSQNLIDLLNDKDDYNVIIEVENKENRIVDLENCETRFIYDLMLAVDGFELEELTNKLETLLIETKGSEYAIVSRLKRDDLQIEEIKIWDYVIKWGIALNPDINQHIALPARPVKSVILPPRTTLITELPHHTKEPFSAIISEEHAAEISAWIDRKTSNYLSTNIPYDFQLFLLGTRDGFTPKTFWDICKGHSNTVVVARVKGTDEIMEVIIL